jgi:hypothetical protein
MPMVSAGGTSSALWVLGLSTSLMVPKLPSVFENLRPSVAADAIVLLGDVDDTLCITVIQLLLHFSALLGLSTLLMIPKLPSVFESFRPSVAADAVVLLGDVDDTLCITDIQLLLHFSALLTSLFATLLSRLAFCWS